LDEDSIAYFIPELCQDSDQQEPPQSYDDVIFEYNWQGGAWRKLLGHRNET
jgi:hypothetical protein